MPIVSGGREKRATSGGRSKDKKERFLTCTDIDPKVGRRTSIHTHINTHTLPAFDKRGREKWDDWGYLKKHAIGPKGGATP